MVGHINFSELENFSNKGKKPFSQTKNAIKGAVGVAAGTGIAAAGAAASRINLSKLVENPESREKFERYLDNHPEIEKMVIKGIYPRELINKLENLQKEAQDHPIKSALSPSYYRKVMESIKDSKKAEDAFDRKMAIGSKAAMIGGAATAGITGTAAIIKAVKAHKAKKLASKIK